MGGRPGDVTGVQRAGAVLEGTGCMDSGREFRVEGNQECSGRCEVEGSGDY